MEILNEDYKDYETRLDVKNTIKIESGRVKRRRISLDENTLNTLLTTATQYNMQTQTNSSSSGIFCDEIKNINVKNMEFDEDKCLKVQVFDTEQCPLRAAGVAATSATQTTTVTPVTVIPAKQLQRAKSKSSILSRKKSEDSANLLMVSHSVTSSSASINQKDLKQNNDDTDLDVSENLSNIDLIPLHENYNYNNNRLSISMNQNGKKKSIRIIICKPYTYEKRGKIFKKRKYSQSSTAMSNNNKISKKSTSKMNKTKLYKIKNSISNSSCNEKPRKNNELVISFLLNLIKSNNCKSNSCNSSNSSIKTRGDLNKFLFNIIVYLLNIYSSNQNKKKLKVINNNNLNLNATTHATRKNDFNSIKAASLPSTILSSISTSAVVSSPRTPSTSSSSGMSSAEIAAAIAPVLAYDSCDKSHNEYETDGCKPRSINSNNSNEEFINDIDELFKQSINSLKEPQKATNSRLHMTERVNSGTTSTTVKPLYSRFTSFNSSSTNQHLKIPENIDDPCLFIDNLYNQLLTCKTQPNQTDVLNSLQLHAKLSTTTTSTSSLVNNDIESTTRLKKLIEFTNLLDKTSTSFKSNDNDNLRRRRRLVDCFNQVESDVDNEIVQIFNNEHDLISLSSSSPSKCSSHDQNNDMLINNDDNININNWAIKNRNYIKSNKKDNHHRHNRRHHQKNQQIVVSNNQVFCDNEANIEETMHELSNRVNKCNAWIDSQFESNQIAANSKKNNILGSLGSSHSMSSLSFSEGDVIRVSSDEAIKNQQQQGIDYCYYDKNSSNLIAPASSTPSESFMSTDYYFNDNNKLTSSLINFYSNKGHAIKGKNKSCPNLRNLCNINTESQFKQVTNQRLILMPLSSSLSLSSHISSSPYYSGRINKPIPIMRTQSNIDYDKNRETKENLISFKSFKRLISTALLLPTHQSNNIIQVTQPQLQSSQPTTINSYLTIIFDSFLKSIKFFIVTKNVLLLPLLIYLLNSKLRINNTNIASQATSLVANAATTTINKTATTTLNAALPVIYFQK